MEGGVELLFIYPYQTRGHGLVEGGRAAVYIPLSNQRSRVGGGG